MPEKDKNDKSNKSALCMTDNHDLQDNVGRATDSSDGSGGAREDRATDGTERGRQTSEVKESGQVDPPETTTEAIGTSSLGPIGGSAGHAVPTEKAAHLSPRADVSPSGTVSSPIPVPAKEHRGDAQELLEAAVPVQSEEDRGLVCVPLRAPADNLPRIRREYVERCLESLSESPLLALSCNVRETGWAIIHELVQRLNAPALERCWELKSASSDAPEFGLDDVVTFLEGAKRAGEEQRDGIRDLYVVDTSTDRRNWIRRIADPSASDPLASLLSAQGALLIGLVPEMKAWQDSMAERRLFGGDWMPLVSSLLETADGELDTIITSVDANRSVSGMLEKNRRVAQLVEWVKHQSKGTARRVYEAGKTHAPSFTAAVARLLPIRYLHVRVETQAAPETDVLALYERCGFAAAALFVAVFFRYLHPDEFFRVALSLCPNSPESPPDNSGEPPEPFTDSERSNRMHVRMDLLVRDGILLIKSLQGETWVELASEELQPKLRSVIFEAHYFRSRASFQTLIERGLLFDPSPEVRAGAILLTTEVMECSQGATPWRIWFEQQIDGPGLPLEGPPLFCHQRSKEVRWEQSVAALLQAILERPAISQLAQEFYNLLLERNHLPLAASVALELEQFSQVRDGKWLDRCLNRAQSHQIPVLRQLLLKYAARRPEAFLELLSHWIPKPELAAERLSRLNQLSLALLFEFWFGNTLKLTCAVEQLATSADNPALRGPDRILRNPLFRPGGRYRTVDEKLALTVPALFHPQLPMSMRLWGDLETLGENEDAYLELIVTFLLTNAFVSLRYASQDKLVEPQAVEVRAALVRQLGLALAGRDNRTRTLKEAVLETWLQLCDYLLDASDPEAAGPDGQPGASKGLLLLRRVMRQARADVRAQIRTS